MIVLTGCSSSSTNEEASSESPAIFSPVLKGGVPGALLSEELKLWNYDFTTGVYVPAEGDATSYTLDLTKPEKTFTLAFMDGWAANPFAIPIRKVLKNFLRILD